MSSSGDTLLGRAAESASRYDLVLAVIPSAFVVALLVVRLLSAPSRTAMAAASAVGALALLDALFLNPPRRPRIGDRPA